MEQALYASAHRDKPAATRWRLMVERVSAGKLAGIIAGCVVVAVMVFMMVAILSGLLSGEP
jgi:predicted phage tail protein